MVPHIAKTGWSFRGAAKYYLHDRQSDTSERVGWTYTHNIPTNDPDRAVKWMINTAQSAGHLKQQAGVTPTGRKMRSGVVYSYSLSWHPEQKPDKQTMLDAALETLQLLKLQEHEALVVNHTDSAHDHVHVVVNLIHPENGKKAVVSYDRLTLSQWAEQLEKSGNKIYCEQRVLNNALRRDYANDNRQLALVKHRDKQSERAIQIQKLYTNTTNGHAFQSALGMAGYTLASGNKGRYVIVDKYGEVYALARQLEGQRAKDLKQRLSDIKELPDAKLLSAARAQPFDREQYETKRQKKIVDAAIEFEKNKTAGNNQDKQATPVNPDTEHLRKLDAIRVWEQKSQQLKDQLQKQQKEQYARQNLVTQIEKLKQEIASQNGIWTRLTGKQKSKQEELVSLNRNLANIDQRISEQNSALEEKIRKTRPGYAEELKRKEEAYNQRISEHQERLNTRNKEPGIER